MNPETATKLIELTASSTQSTLQHYARFLVLQSWIALFIAFVLAVVALRLVRIAKEARPDDKAAWVALCIGCFATSAAIAIACIPVISSPQAAAIHQLLQDVTGK